MSEKIKAGDVVCLRVSGWCPSMVVGGVSESDKAECFWYDDEKREMLGRWLPVAVLEVVESAKPEKPAEPALSSDEECRLAAEQLIADLQEEQVRANRSVMAMTAEERMFLARQAAFLVEYERDLRLAKSDLEAKLVNSAKK